MKKNRNRVYIIKNPKTFTKTEVKPEGND